MSDLSRRGWVCEIHSERPWPHDDCAGLGVRCPDCPLHRGSRQTGNPSSPDGRRHEMDEIAERLKRDSEARVEESRRLIEAATEKMKRKRR